MPDKTLQPAPGPAPEPSLGRTTAPEVLWLPPRWIMEHYRSTEGETWERTRYYFETAHTHLDDLLRHIAQHGVRRPVELDPVERVVRRGHHRLLYSSDASVPYVPAVFAWLDETWWWDPATGLDVEYGPDDFDDWDDDEPLEPWVDRIYPVPDDARAVARDVVHSAVIGRPGR